MQTINVPDSTDVDRVLATKMLDVAFPPKFSDTVMSCSNIKEAVTLLVELRTFGRLLAPVTTCSQSKADIAARMYIARNVVKPISAILEKRCSVHASVLLQAVHAVEEKMTCWELSRSTPGAFGPSVNIKKIVQDTTEYYHNVRREELEQKLELKEKSLSSCSTFASSTSPLSTVPSPTLDSLHFARLGVNGKTSHVSTLSKATAEDLAVVGKKERKRQRARAKAATAILQSSGVIEKKREVDKEKQVDKKNQTVKEKQADKKNQMVKEKQADKKNQMVKENDRTSASEFHYGLDHTTPPSWRKSKVLEIQAALTEAKKTSGDPFLRVSSDMMWQLIKEANTPAKRHYCAESCQLFPPHPLEHARHYAKRNLNRWLKIAHELERHGRYAYLSFQITLPSEKTFSLFEEPPTELFDRAIYWSALAAEVIKLAAVVQVTDADTLVRKWEGYANTLPVSELFTEREQQQIRERYTKHVMNSMELCEKDREHLLSLTDSIVRLTLQSQKQTLSK